MNKEEALKMLEDAESEISIHGDGISKVNPSLTRLQAIEIVKKGIESCDGELIHLMEKRVYQVCRNQRRPRF